MSVPMKKRPTNVKTSYNEILYLTSGNKIYAIPKKIAEQYIVANDHGSADDNNSVAAETVFAQLEKRLTKSGALLKGLRTRENLSQTKFAKKIKTTQANFSNMENGHRPIGKQMAKRIEKEFGVDYRYFLE